jgi:hypothetical protein
VSRSARFLAAALFALAVLLPGVARAEPPTPANNLDIGFLPNYCQRANPPLTCTNGVIYYLDRARAAMGLPPYALPADFLEMTPAQQIFILTNLDRTAYGLPPVTGLVAGLDAGAAVAAQRNVDPQPTDDELGRPLLGWASNWAAGFPTATAAYFFWVYRDGYSSGNVDCPTPTATGCWGHRRGTFWVVAPTAGPPDPYLYSMGAAATTDERGSAGYAMTITGSFPAAPPSYYYTWAQALAEGAGSNVYAVSAPVTEKAVLTVRFRGQGTVAGTGLLCRYACRRGVSKYELIRLRAHPARGYRFVGWRGCPKPLYAVCTTELEADQTVKVLFARTHRRRA